MTDPREHRDEVLSRLAEGPIHTRMHMVHEALEEVRIERIKGASPNPAGNRRQRRAAAAMARKGRPVVMPPTYYPVDPETLTVARGRGGGLPAVGSFHN